MAAATHYAWFDTPIGDCAIVWGEAGVRGLMLPGADRARTLASLRRRHPQACECAPTAAIATAIIRLQALLDGQAEGLEQIALDMDGVPEFHRRVYEAARRIGPGRTCTYGELAEALGEPGAARSVGQALGANPFAIIVPCHRVLAAGGRSGGFSAPGGVDTKRRLLEIERARIGNEPTLF
ncbi:MAG: methylated-DNA--[protein]-cysteine S-methyltransferase [Proteobacteria bacterium]|nr:methylated-DNA--[protein]-cysteine S-methyltransferase [Pseudomonadota bacterium]